MQICLIFAWGFFKGSNDELSFVSLEPVARQLHVNLSKVIVYNCCPAVPSHGGISRRGRYNPNVSLYVIYVSAVMFTRYRGNVLTL